jgi:hypothetical protein
MQLEADAAINAYRLWTKRPGARQRQRRRLITMEAFCERIRIVETFGPNMLRKRLR